MNEQASAKQFVNWRWVETGFCLYVLFHLFPLYALVFARSGMGDIFSFALWTFIGLAPIGCFIGYKSRNVTIVEPGISALLYSFVLVIGMIQFGDKQVEAGSVALFLTCMGSAFLIAVASAWVGRRIQQTIGRQKEPAAG